MDQIKKDLAIIFGLFLLIVVLLVFGRGFTSNSFLPGTIPVLTASPSPELSGMIPVNVSSLSLVAQVASTPDERKRGLSEHDDLAINQGMLFVFEKRGIYSIWMKDMKFAIDIIWIGEDKMISDIAENAVPEPGKSDRELKIYKPNAESKYVLEINAGLVKLHNLRIGDKVNF